MAEPYRHPLNTEKEGEGEGSLNKYYADPKNQKAMKKAMDEYYKQEAEKKNQGEGQLNKYYQKKKKGKAEVQAESLEK